MSTSLMSHSGSRIITRSALSAIQAPQATNTYTPVPYEELLRMIETAAETAGIKFKQSDSEKRFKLAISPTGGRLFGVCDLSINVDGVFDIAIGFRTSHNKTMSVQLSIGEHVTVCDNMMMTGDLAVHEIHGAGLSFALLQNEINKAFDAYPRFVEEKRRSYNEEVNDLIPHLLGRSMILDAYNGGALPGSRALQAAIDWDMSYDGECVEKTRIQYGGTMWALRQCVTKQWKDSPITRIDKFSQKLRAAWRLN